MERLNWAISNDLETDWDIGYLGITDEQIKEITGRKLPKFNQWNYSESINACTIVWATREYCYQNYIEFSVWLMLDIIKYAEKENWYIIGNSWNSSLGMNAVRKFFGNECNYVKVTYNDPIIAQIYSKNNVLGITYKGNKDWNVDSDDWELIGKRFEPTSYWHRTSTQYDIDKKKIYINDSYDWTKGNIYQVKYLFDLVNGVNIYPTFYYWIPKVKNETEVKEIYQVIQWYDDIIKEMMDQYRLLKKEGQDRERKKLLKNVADIRRQKQKYIDILRNTQKT